MTTAVIRGLARWDHALGKWVPLLGETTPPPPPPPPPPPSGVPTLVVGSVITNWTHPTTPTGDPIVEASGLVVHPTAGTLARPIFGIHNDSGNPPEVYWCQATGTSARVLLTQTLSASNQDWEDMTLALGPSGVAGGLTDVMVANVGNATPDSAVAFHRWALPTVALDQTYATATVAAGSIDTFTVAAADRPSPNCEAIAQDPLTGDVFWFAKVNRGDSTPPGLVAVWVAAGAQFAVSGDHPVSFTFLCDWKLNRAGTIGPTGADISADGSQLLVGNYQEVYTAHRDAAAGETMQDAITRAASSADGYDSYTAVGSTGTREAFALSRDKLRTYTISDADPTCKVKFWDNVLEGGGGGGGSHYTDLGTPIHTFDMALDAGWWVLNRGNNPNQGPRVGENVVNVSYGSINVDGTTYRSVTSIQIWTRTFAAAGFPDGLTIAGVDFTGADYCSGMLQHHGWNLGAGDLVFLARMVIPGGTTVNTRQATGQWGEDINKEWDAYERGGAKADGRGGATNDHWNPADNKIKHGPFVFPDFDGTQWGEWLWRRRLDRMEVWRNGVLMSREMDLHVWTDPAFFFAQTAIETPADSATCTPFAYEIAAMRSFSAT